jgi:hypothetical protein
MSLAVGVDAVAESIEAVATAQPISDQTKGSKAMAICRVFAPFMQMGTASIVDL